MFWLCDINLDGKTFKLHHMKCAENRIFEPLLKECVLYSSTTREIRAENNVSSTFNQFPKNLSKLNNSIDLKMDENFTCNDKEPGKFSDDKNCHIYHICISTCNIQLYNQYVFLCPDNLSYDPDTGKCNQISYSRCEERRDVDDGEN